MTQEPVRRDIPDDAVFYLIPNPKRTGPPRTTFPYMAARHAQALGFMVAHWGIMESTLDFFLHVMFGLRGDAAFVPSAELSSLQRFAMIRALLFETREQEWVDDWEGFMQRFEALRALRNDAVHGQWERGKDTYTAHRRTARGRLIHRTVEFPTERLNQLTEDIIELYNEIDFMTFRIGPKVCEILRAGPTKPPLIPGQGRNAQAQAQARAAKQARKRADRERSKGPLEKD
jgi:hypothetical protein